MNRFASWLSAGRLRSRILVTAVLFVSLYDIFTRGTLRDIRAACVVLALFLILFWIPRTWWTPKRYAVAVVVFALVATFNVLYVKVGFWSITILYYLIGFIASRLRERLAVLLCLLIGAVMLVLTATYSDSTANDFLWYIISGIAIFLGIRGYRMRIEAFELSELHLEELQKAHQDLQEATVHSMQHAVLEERTRIARDIHDSLGHSLTSLIVQLQALQYMIPDGPPEAKEAVQNMLAVSRRSLGEIRTSIHALADEKKEAGLTSLRALLAQVQAHTNLTCRFHVEDASLELSTETTVVLYRVLQEAATNAVRHADATLLEATLSQKENRALLLIQDDGTIQPGTTFHMGFGMKGMRDRLEAIGGHLHVEPREPHGLRILAEVPLTEEGES